mmetsp:Transcript_39785/g.89300  ORF Transcript_39785/g.89300 Transcript_39785/m.89300 type:complete len:274 (-) Transcript_39785:315-1136(-)
MLRSGRRGDRGWNPGGRSGVVSLRIPQNRAKTSPQDPASCQAHMRNRDSTTAVGASSSERLIVPDPSESRSFQSRWRLPVKLMRLQACKNSTRTTDPEESGSRDRRHARAKFPCSWSSLDRNTARSLEASTLALDRIRCCLVSRLVHLVISPSRGSWTTKRAVDLLACFLEPPLEWLDGAGCRNMKSSSLKAPQPRTSRPLNSSLCSPPLSGMGMPNALQPSTKSWKSTEDGPRAVSAALGVSSDCRLLALAISANVFMPPRNRPLTCSHHER